MNDIEDVKVLAKFEVRLVEYGDENKTRIYSLFNSDGGYMGAIFPDDVINSHIKFLMEHQIIPETYGGNTVCSIGKSLKDGKWYGWSHRAIYGFQIGDTLKEGDCAATSGYTEEYLEEHPDPYILPVGFTSETEEDCKLMAIAFASSVS